jgi:hypothetical protein
LEDEKLAKVFISLRSSSLTLRSNVPVPILSTATDEELAKFRNLKLDWSVENKRCVPHNGMSRTVLTGLKVLPRDFTHADFEIVDYAAAMGIKNAWDGFQANGHATGSNFGRCGPFTIGSSKIGPGDTGYSLLELLRKWLHVVRVSGVTIYITNATHTRTFGILNCGPNFENYTNYGIIPSVGFYEDGTPVEAHSVEETRPLNMIVREADATLGDSPPLTKYRNPHHHAP